MKEMDIACIIIIIAFPCINCIRQRKISMTSIAYICLINLVLKDEKLKAYIQKEVKTYPDMQSSGSFDSSDFCRKPVYNDKAPP